MNKKIVQLKDEKNSIMPLPVTVSDAVYLTNVGPLREAVGMIPANADVNGMTLTQFINQAYGSGGTFTFLHISDTHKFNHGITKCIELMVQDTDIPFTIITGDLQLTGEMKSTILASDKPFLLMLGNHDVADDFGGDQIGARNTYIAPFCEKYVSMGSQTSSYWYKDVTTPSATIRIIAFDEYEYVTVGSPATSRYSVVYSQQQIDWFIDLLKSTPPSYYLILAHHQPASAFRNNGTGKFISEKAPNWYEHEGALTAIPELACLPHLLPMILDAYLNGGTVSGEYYCGDTLGTKMTLDVDFSGISPCKFLFHIGGHTHWDVCEYLPLYPSQLQLIIDEDRPAQYVRSDLPRSEADETAYCINKVMVDFENKKTVVERIGAHITDSGTDRNVIEYPFVK